MSILVLGGAGYIGSHTALELIRTAVTEKRRCSTVSILRTAKRRLMRLHRENPEDNHTILIILQKEFKINIKSNSL